MRRISILACAWLLLSGSAFAAECEDQTQTGLNRCADAAYQKADAALNGVYNEITRRLKGDSATKQLLTAAQKAWLGFRDAECTFANAANAGGSIYPMVHAECLERLTKARTGDLRAYLKCGEGDLGCPVPNE
jgi:uncharacterized protein YecT (DUF1311 family)